MKKVGLNLVAAVVAALVTARTSFAAAPTNSAVPTVSGYAHIGYVLSAVNGTWAGSPVMFTYQWQACTDRGDVGTCANIAGATRPTYIPVAGNAGEGIRVKVTAVNRAKESASAYSAITAYVSNAAPANWVVPVVSGYEHVGYALSSTTGTFDAPRPTYTFQWQRCTDQADAGTCLDITGATRATYTAVSGDADKFLRVGVVARNTQAQFSAVAYSLIDQTAIGNSAPVNWVAPVVSGYEHVGYTLSSTTGMFDAPKATVTYLWQRCTDQADAGTCTNIAGATRPTYTAVTGDAGKFLRVGVVARNTQGQSSAVAYSSMGQTAVANNQEAPVYRSGMTIDNAAPDPGDVLTADPGSWGGVPAPTFRYQWLRCPWTDAGVAVSAGCIVITNATSSTYAAVPADTGKKLRVKVLASNFVRSNVTHVSLPTGVVGAVAPANTVASSITGSAVSGHTLTAHTGTWTGVPAPTFTYQWERCSDDSDPDECSSIAGASHSTYLLVNGDGGSSIRVVVTGTNGSGSDTSTSAATAAVVAAPGHTARASISGSAGAGQTLTADPGIWTGYPAPTLTYQWLSCTGNAYTGNCSDIDGATDSTYDLVDDDVGAHIRVVVTGTNGSGSDTSISAATAAVGVAPYKTRAASIDNTTPSVGELLTASRGSWHGLPAPTFTYQWQRCSDSGDLGSCSDILGATESTYLLVYPVDVGAYLRVVVTGTNDSGSDTSISELTAAVEAAPAVPVAPENTVAASISGSAVAGQTLTADAGTWTGTPAPTLTYQWQRCSDSGDLGSCSDIEGATDSTYLLVDPDDVGAYVRVVVTGTNDSGSDTSASELTAAVEAAPAVPVAPENTVAASISGSAVAGQTLTADAGTWTGISAPTLTYQWQRCSDSGDLGTCSDVDGATESTYLLVDPDDVGAFVRAVVTGTNDSGSSTSASELTAAVDAAPAAPVSTVAASISGSAVAGQTLTADAGTWTGISAPTLTYQWQRCSDSGDLGTCSDVDGATESTYLLVDPDDVGAFVRAVVTGTNDSGSSTSASELTAAVDAAPAAPVSTVAASISGSAVAGETLTADPGTWTGNPAPTLTYQWQRCSDSGDLGTCSDVDGATESTYLLVDPDDVGAFIRVVVTGTNDSGTDTWTSELTDQVPGS